MKKKAAKIIRIITIPPVEALAMLLILYGTMRESFGSSWELLVAILFLAVIPACAYPIASKGKNRKEIRRNQRKMAFIFNFLSYLAAMLTGYGTGCPGMLQWILNGYFGSVLILTIINKGFRIKASGHACSCTLPYLFISYYLGWTAVVICVLLYAAEFWASVELKRHTVKEFVLGSAVACLVFSGVIWMQSIGM